MMSLLKDGFPKALKWLIPVALISLGAIHCAKPPAGDMPFRLRFSTPSVPGDAHTVCLTTFKEEIEKSSGGRIRVEIFHSGQLFSQEAEQAAVRRGSVEMIYTGCNWLADYLPYLSMFTMGYLFSDYGHMNRVLNGEIGRAVFNDMADKIGVRPLGAFYLGTRQLNLRDIGRAIRKPEDLKGVKLRMPDSPTWLFLGRALGANPTMISFTELYMALNAGTVDGQDNPLPTIRNTKFYEVTKYIILTDHYIHPILPCINEKVWRELGPDLQSLMHDAVEKARVVCDSLNLAAEAELVDFFKQQGLIVIHPDKEAFKSHVMKTYLENKAFTDEWDMQLYEQVKALDTGPSLSPAGLRN